MLTTHRKQLANDVAFARLEFGMSKNEFFSQTPTEWVALCEQWKSREKYRKTRADRSVARICMVLSMCHGAQDATEEDFMPGPRKEQTPEEMMAALDAVFYNHG